MGTVADFAVAIQLQSPNTSANISSDWNCFQH